MAHNWDIKRLVKQMVTSATYRQSAVISPDKLAADPDNANSPAWANNWAGFRKNDMALVSEFKTPVRVSSVALRVMVEEETGVFRQVPLRFGEETAVIS